MRLLIFIISSLMLVLGSCRSTQKTVAEIEGVSVEAMPTKPDTTTQHKTTTKRKTHRQRPQSTTTRTTSPAPRCWIISSTPISASRKPCASKPRNRKQQRKREDEK